MTMKSALQFVAAAVFAATISVPAVQAQSGRPLYVDIPFAYTVSGKTLPAGSYEFFVADGSQYVLLRSRTDRKVAMVAGVDHGTRGNRKETGALIFHRYDDQYFLNEVWSDGGDRGVRVHPSKAEKEYLAKMPKSVILAARKQ